MGRRKIDEDEDGNILTSLESSDINQAIKEYIITYFKFKKSSIPISILHLQKYIDIVKKTRIHKIIGQENVAGMDLIYKALGSSPEQKDDEIGTITEDTKLVIEMFKECRQLQIPKAFASGLVIMYLDLIEGREIIE